MMVSAILPNGGGGGGAERNKMREPRQRRFTAGSPGCQGGGD
ncbi:hypothetical protein [Escherichia coli]